MTPEEREHETETPVLPGAVERERTDLSAVSIMAAIALIVVGGLWFYTRDREMVSSDGTVKQTTGSGASPATQPPPPVEPVVPVQPAPAQ